MEMALEKKTEVESVEKIALLEYIAYFFYGFGQVLNYAMVGTFIAIFYTDYLFVSASFIGGLFLVSRILDAVIDPFMGALIDKTNSPKGKFRLWMKWGSLAVVASTMILFIPWSLDGQVLLAIISITYILWGVLYTLSDVPFWSLSTAMSNDGQERSKAVTVANAGVNLGFLLPGLLVPISAKYIGHHILGYDVANNTAFMQGLPWAMLFLSVTTIPMMIFGYSFTKERRSKHIEKVSFKEMVQTVRSAKPLFVICIIFFLDIFWDLQTALITYFFVWNLGDAQNQATVAFWSMFGFIFLVFYPMLTKRFKKKWILQTQLILDTILRCSLFILGYENHTFVIILLVALSFIRTMASSVIPNMIGESVEYCEYKTGNRTEALVFSFQTFTGKLKTAFALGLSGFLLTVIGYTPSVTSQSNSTLHWIFVICILVPAIGNILKLFVSFYIKFSEDEFKEVVKFIKHKNSRLNALTENNQSEALYHIKKMEEIQAQLEKKGI
ncbi:MFS transporter [Bacillus sp. mrc49]|uniref:MFS transporter n=1 Tax=Bacillus sp. mrc49 TaxID=2054913 RepID=UPI0012FD05CB|nr:glycoside-pentoside-hexuronide (GPH):cation symporter [Bacillus sp. mrc49]